MESNESERPHCPSGGDCESCGGKCHDDTRAVHENLKGVRHIFLVMSGKGGVGKSTVAANLAASLSLRGWQTGLLDVDFHGPSIPKMLGLEGASLYAEGEKLLPVEMGALNMKVMSIGFTLPQADHAVIWRGAMKHGIIRQLLGDVLWGDLDALVIDTPPGTGDECLSTCQLLPQADGAVLVTTPQQVSASDVSKSLNFLSQLSLPVLGIVENMSGFVCPHCGERVEIFSRGAGEELARKYDVPFLGRLPLDPQVCAGGDAGEPFVERYAASATATAFEGIVDQLLPKQS
ncbi:MAG: P-loop NTPase [Oligosphaeraceae bacterium]